MPLSLICASHTPLLHRVPVQPTTAMAVRAAFERASEAARRFQPDLIIQFGPDHYQGFFHRTMPPYCIATAATSAADWDIAHGTLSVPRQDAEELAVWLRDRQFDVCVSRDMIVDHGFLQLWQEMGLDFRSLPIIPIFINSIAPPLASYARIRSLGEQIGQFALSTGKRVLIAASGGLSHDPPVPSIGEAAPEVRLRLLRGNKRSESEQSQHEQRLAAVGIAAAKGEGPCKPINEAWDRSLLARLNAGDLTSFDSFDHEAVSADAGRAANEVLVWIAAFAALSAAGRYKMDLLFYEPIPAWIAGMAIATAESTGQ